MTESRLTLTEQKGDTTSKIKQKLSICDYVMGSDISNAHIPHDRGLGQFIMTSLKKNGVSTLAQEYMSKAIESKTGIAQTWMAHFPIFFVIKPALIQQIIKFNNELLFDGETGGVQERFFGDGTIISLTRHDPRYRPYRGLAMAHLFNPIAKLATPMQIAMSPYIKELADSKHEIELENFTARAAMTIISQTQLGFENFPEEYKTELAGIVHGVVQQVPNPITAGLISVENTIKNKIRVKANLNWSLDRLAKRGEEIITKVVQLNEAAVLEKIKSLKNNPLLTVKDLYKPETMSLIKLFLIGGFETTAKLLLYSILMLADPKNTKYVKQLQDELSQVKKPAEQFQTADLENLHHLHAFVYEVLRLYPPFSYMRHSAIKDFSIAQFPGITEAKQEYWEKFNDPKRDRSDDIFIPSGSMIVMSVYDAHRDESLYGKDAAIFNPDRWLGKKFSLRDIMARSDFYTVGNDSRACPGRLFSEQEALLFVARLATNFTIKANLDFDKPLPINVGFTLELADNANVKAAFTPIFKEDKEDKKDRNETKEILRM